MLYLSMGLGSWLVVIVICEVVFIELCEVFVLVDWVVVSVIVFFRESVGVGFVCVMLGIVKLMMGVKMSVCKKWWEKYIGFLWVIIIVFYREIDLNGVV